MIRILATFLVAWLVAACGGDDDAARPTAVPATATPATAVEASPAPNAPAYGVVALPPQPPARTVRAEPAPEVLVTPLETGDAPQVLFYSVQTDRTVGVGFDPRGGPFWGWTPSGAVLVSSSSGLVMYEPRTGNAQRLVIGDEVINLMVGPSTRTALMLADGNLAILDLATSQLQPLALQAWGRAWSPDGKRLLVQVRDAGLAVVLLDQPIARLFTLPTDGTLQYAGWTSDTTLLVMRSGALTGAPLADVLDVSGPALRITQRPSPPFSVNIHPGAIRLAAAHFVRPDVAMDVSIYDALSLRKERELPGLMLGGSHEGGALWSRDARRIVLTSNRCSGDERIVVVDVTTGARTEVAKDGAFQLAMSPDGGRVAYTAGGLFIVPSDASSAPRRVFARVHDPWPIRWSPDSGTIGFVNFYGGGYGRCG